MHTDINNLVLKVRENDEAAFAEIVERYSPMMRKLAADFSMGNRVSAEELFSEACVALHKAALSYNVEQIEVTFGLYARICVYNRLVDFADRVRPIATVDNLDIDSLAVPSGIQAQLEKEEMSSALRECARRVLSEYEYRVFSLCLAGYKTAEIAKVLNKSAKSVDNAKLRMHKHLRDGLDSIFRS